MINNDTTLVSKHQLLDYVSKRDFNDLTADVRDFREETEARFDSVDSRLGTIELRLSGHDKRFDSIEKRFNDMDRRFDEIKELIRVQTGAILDQFREDLKTGMEFVQNIEKTKVDEIRFDELKEKVDRLLKGK